MLPQNTPKGKLFSVSLPNYRVEGSERRQCVAIPVPAARCTGLVSGDPPQNVIYNSKEICYTALQKGCGAMRSDCHMHMILDGYEWKSAIARHAQKTDDAWIRQQIEIYHKQGYTYLRDGGDRWGAGKRAREIAKEYAMTYRTPLANLCKAGHYGAFIGKKYENFREYRELICRQRQEGADFVKIMISGLMDFDHFGRLTEDGLPEAEIRELIHIAHEEGFSVMAHCNGARTAEAAAAAGLDSVEHGAYLDKDALQTMADMGTVWVPTLSTIGNLRGKGRFNEEAVQKILDSALENVRDFAAMGGLVAPGSDAGAWAVPHGSMTEFALLEQALGQMTETVLEAGTRKIKEKF